MSASDSNDSRPKDKAEKKSKSEDRKKKEALLMQDLSTSGLKLAPVEKSGLLKSKTCKKKMPAKAKKTCNGKDMPPPRELKAMYEDESDEPESKDDLLAVLQSNVEIKTIADRMIVMFNTLQSENADGMNSFETNDFFGTDALNREPPKPNSNDNIPCVYRFLNPREEPLPESNKKKKCNVGKPSTRSNAGGSKEPCTCAENNICKRRGHKKKSMRLIRDRKRIDGNSVVISDDSLKLRPNNVTSDLIDLSDVSIDLQLNSAVDCNKINIDEAEIETSFNALRKNCLGERSLLPDKHYPANGDEMDVESVPVDEDLKDKQSYSELSPSSSTTIIYSLNEDELNNVTETVEKAAAQNSFGSNRSFSPIPSTSRDNAIFELNNQKFIYSLGTDGNDDSSEEVVTDKSQLDANVAIDVLDETAKTTEDVEIVVDHKNESVCEENSKLEPVKVESIDNLLEMINVDDSNDSDDDCVAVDDILLINNSILSKFNSTKSTRDSSVVCVDDLQCDENSKENNDDVNIPKSVPENFSFTELLKNIVSGICDSPKTMGALFGKNPVAYISELFSTNEAVQNIESIVAQAINSTDVDPGTQRRKRKQKLKSNSSKRSKIIDTIDLVDACDNSPQHVPQSFTDSNFIIDLDCHCQVASLETVQMPGTSALPANPPLETPLFTPTVVNDVWPPSPPKSGLYGDCPVCLESFSSKTMASTLCGHLFCLDCLKMVMQTNKRCPTCRKVIKKNGYHQIFI